MKSAVDTFALQAIRAFDYWVMAGDCRKRMPPEFVNYIVKGYQKGASYPDATFLRSLADAFELYHCELFRAHSQVFTVLRNCKEWGFPMPCVTGVYEGLLERGFKVSRKTVANWFRAFGVKPGKAKPGPPKGTKQKQSAIRVNRKFGKA
jgi:hypothetical protein